MAETVLVTGGTGYVAGWCIVELLKRGYAVRTTVRTLSKESAVRKAVASPAGLGADAGDRLTFFAADLTKDDGWNEAVAGCDYVLHVASPLGVDSSRDPNALIVPAREGTLRVLRAATNAGIKRVVFTSSTAAATPPVQSGDSVNDETVWTDPNDPDINAYRQSKALAERAAWDFMTANPGSTTLTTILPSAVFGPVLTMENLGSVQVIQRMLDGRLPGTPRIGFCVVDVRDVADAHIRAMTLPEAAGQRFIAAGEFMWMEEIAQTLRTKLGEPAGKVLTRRLPNFVVKLMALINPPLRAVTPTLGRKHVFNSAKAQRVLGFSPRPAATTVVECAESLIAGKAAQTT